MVARGCPTAEGRGRSGGGRSRVPGVPQSARASPTSLSLAPFPPRPPSRDAETALHPRTRGPGLQTRARVAPLRVASAGAVTGPAQWRTGCGAGDFAHTGSCGSQTVGHVPLFPSRTGVSLNHCAPRATHRDLGRSAAQWLIVSRWHMGWWQALRPAQDIASPEATSAQTKTQNEALRHDASLLIPMTFTVVDVTLDPGRACSKPVWSKDRTKEASGCRGKKKSKLPQLQITAREKQRPNDRVCLATAAGQHTLPPFPVG